MITNITVFHQRSSATMIFIVRQAGNQHTTRQGISSMWSHYTAAFSYKISDYFM
ncbi:hypothetical protein BMETH_1077_3 [methanotrophic bacterial endosymbiont of Bathymodiolus sp.]|nr:hypothetical protein BMETH_1077_3 [methanotrophic bacterial endosymbiont of Bathymodiolus sp.]